MKFLIDSFFVMISLFSCCIEGSYYFCFFIARSFFVISSLQDHKCIGQLKEYLMANCEDKGRLSDLTSLLAEQAKDVGILVSQHVANFPPQLLPPLYEGLFDEVLWATEDEVR